MPLTDDKDLFTEGDNHSLEAYGLFFIFLSVLLLAETCCTLSVDVTIPRSCQSVIAAIFNIPNSLT